MVNLFYVRFKRELNMNYTVKADNAAGAVEAARDLLLAEVEPSKHPAPWKVAEVRAANDDEVEGIHEA